MKFAKDENKAINFALSVPTGRCLNKAISFPFAPEEQKHCLFWLPQVLFKNKNSLPAKYVKHHSSLVIY